MCALVTGVQTCALPILTGALDRIDIRGSGGLRLKDCWSDGPTTFLGLQSRGFPNFFTLVGPHNGSTFCNVGVCGGLQAEWVARMIAYMTDHGLTFSQPLAVAEEAWTEEIYRDFVSIVLSEANAWWVMGTETHAGGLVLVPRGQCGAGPA